MGGNPSEVLWLDLVSGYRVKCTHLGHINPPQPHAVVCVSEILRGLTETVVPTFAEPLETADPAS